MPEIKRGALTLEELKTLWRSLQDSSFTRALERAGFDAGLESHWQMLAQMQRVSQAIDRTTQQMYFLPWSGQTDEPASGARKSTVSLTLARTEKLQIPLIVTPDVGMLHTPTFPTDTGPTIVFTGRRYLPNAEVVFFPGDAGPIALPSTAELPGTGYDNALPGTIVTVEQLGLNHENDHATVQILTAPKPKTVVITPNIPDTFVPEHIGQYVHFTSGLNVGQYARIVEFVGPNLTVYPATGSQVTVEIIVSCNGGTYTGTFNVGEVVTGPTFSGTVLAVRYALSKCTIVLSKNTGSVATGDTLTGATSTATLLVANVLYDNTLLAETPIASVGGASWEIVEWSAEFGLSVTNAASPVGGRLAMLDELSQERSINRANGEDDESTRRRATTAADVVAPNALIRTALRALPEGTSVQLREASSEFMRGMYCDGTPEADTLVAGRGFACSFDLGSIEYLGALTFGTSFIEGEPVMIEDAGGLFLCKSDHGVAGPYVAGSQNTLLGSLKVAWRFAEPARVGTGYRVRGKVSGAIFTISDYVPNDGYLARKYRFLMDRANELGFFWMDVPPMPYGEFGCAFDSSKRSALDARACFDGNPVIANRYYQAVNQGLQEAHAGGVGFQVRVTDDPPGEDTMDNFTSHTLVDPVLLPGAQLVLESDVGITLDGFGNVSAWINQVTQTTAAQATAGNRPGYVTGIGSTHGLVFDGTKSLVLPLRIVFPSAWTVMMVVQLSQTPAAWGGSANPGGTVLGDSGAVKGEYGVALDLGSSKPIETSYDGAAWNAAFGVFTFEAGGSVPDNTMRVAAVTHAGTEADTYNEGLFEDSNLGAPFTYSARGLDLVGIGNGGTDGFVGRIYALYAFSTVLSDRNLRLLAYRARVKFGGR